MTKNALLRQISLSKYVLVDYNWNLNVYSLLRIMNSFKLTISSDKIAKSQKP